MWELLAGHSLVPKAEPCHDHLLTAGPSSRAQHSQLLLGPLESWGWVGSCCADLGTQSV